MGKETKPTTKLFIAQSRNVLGSFKQPFIPYAIIFLMFNLCF